MKTQKQISYWRSCAIITTAIIVAAGFQSGAPAQSLLSNSVWVKDGEVQEPGRSAIIALVKTENGYLASNLVGWALSSASNVVNGAVANVQATINAQEATGFIRSYVVELGVSEAIANTNAAVSIVKFDVEDIAQGVRCYIYSVITGAQGGGTGIQYSTNLTSAESWSMATTTHSYATNIVINSTAYDATCSIVELDSSYDVAYFRVVASIAHRETGAGLPITGGLSVQGEEGISETFIVGDKTYTFKYGVKVGDQINTMSAELDNAIISNVAQPLMMRTMIADTPTLTPAEITALLKAREILTKLNPE